MSTDPMRVQGKALSAPEPHQRLLLADRYRLDTVIGRGGMGQVWHGWDELLERPVAVKVLHEILQDGATAERFALEARTAAQLNHPHVVAVYDFGTDQDRPYLVMELVTGRSLAQELEDVVALDPSRAATLGAQVAAGLASAHRHGVVHRDIKPGNLLLDGEGSVCIADFGIARFTQETTTAVAPTAAGQVIGTVAYLAPERALGRPTTPASDLYALGCVLYQLLTGTVPFTTDLPAATLYQHVHTEPDPPHHVDPAIPVALSQYVLRLLAKDPDERPTAEQTEDGLRQWILEPAPPLSSLTTPDAARSPLKSSAPAPDTLGPSQRDRLRSPRRYLLVTGTAVATVAAVTAGVLALSSPPADTGRHPSRSQPAAASSAPAPRPPRTGPNAPPHRASPTQPATSTARTRPATNSSRPNTAARPNQGGSQHDEKQKKAKKPKK